MRFDSAPLQKFSEVFDVVVGNPDGLKASGFVEVLDDLPTLKPELGVARIVHLETLNTYKGGIHKYSYIELKMFLK